MSAAPVPVTFLQDDSTHALRNPMKEVIPPKTGGPCTTHTTTNARRQVLAKNRAALQDDYTNFLEKQGDKYNEIAKIHGKKPEYIRRVLTSASQVKPTRKPSLYNALVHSKGLELNEGEQFFLWICWLRITSRT